MASPSVVLGLPKKLQSQPEAALSAGCYSQMNRVFPNNVSSIVSNAWTASLPIASYPPTNSFPVQEVRFSIPAGMGRNVFCDTSKSRLNFRLKITQSATTAPTAAQRFKMNTVSSAYSWFDRVQTINQNGVAVDDVVGLAQIMCHKNNFEFDSAERDSMWQYGFRGEYDGVIAPDASAEYSKNYLQGHTIYDLSAVVVPASSIYFDYSIPLPSSLLGVGARNFCPIGALSALSLSLWTNNIIPVVYQVIGAAFTTAPSFTFTLDNMSIDLNYIYLDQMSTSLLNMGKEYYVHSITQRLSTGVINAGTTGQTSVLMGLRGRSVRSIAVRLAESVQTTAGCINSMFDSKLLPSTQLNLFLNGKNRFPNVPHNTVTAPSTVFEHALQAAEAFTPDRTKFGGTVLSFTDVFAGTTGASQLSAWSVTAGSSSSPDSLSAFTFAEDLRVVSSSILDGQDLSQSASHFLELNIAAAPTNGVNVSFISANDIIYVIDMEAGTLEARI
jgi:hypothetical protein